ncbi:MAG: hypothetical protein O3A85_06965 [Proteobacteria bacterium]|nr:hypothetical protein [Pseudomonadota bacterium]
MAISSVSGSGYSILSLQSRLQKFTSDRLARDQAAILNGFSHKTSAQQRVGAQWEALRPNIDSAVSYLQDLKSRVEEIKVYVRKLADLENRARTGTASQIAQYVFQFDDTLRKLNQAANATSQRPNLIGGTFANDYSYINDITNGQASFAYNDLSSNYTIVDSGGNTWAKSTSTDRIVINGNRVADNSNTSSLVQYDSSGNATGISAVITQDLQLDSLSGNSIGFTQISTSTSFTGATLSTSGLNILDSWAYAGLATSAGRARAASAIESALTTVNAKIQVYGSALSRATFDSGFAEIYAAGTNGRISTLNRQQLLAMQESSQAAVRNIQAGNFAINRNSGLRASYMALLKTGSPGTFFNIQT